MDPRWGGEFGGGGFGGFGLCDDGVVVVVVVMIVVIVDGIGRVDAVVKGGNVW